MTDPTRESQDNQNQVNVITQEDVRKQQMIALTKLVNRRDTSISRENVAKGYEGR